VSQWTYADIYEEVAGAIPDAPCQVQGERVVRWGEFDARANALAQHLLDVGLGEQAKVAAYLSNGPEYLETYTAAFKAGLVPVNTNFRYGAEELLYLWDNADAEAIVFHARYSGIVDSLRARLPKVRSFLVVDDGHPAPDWATSYAEVAAEATGRTLAPWGRSPDHLLLLYTGGTTGMPKGVMWRQEDLFLALGGGGYFVYEIPPLASVEEAGTRLDGPGPVTLPACPLMHGTGMMNSMLALCMGGSVVTLESPGFDPEELFRAVERNQVYAVSIVGDAFARPILEALRANPAAHDLSSLRLINSSGVMWSQEIKEALLEILGDEVTLFDSYGSSEAIGLGGSLVRRGESTSTARFDSGVDALVISDEGRPVEPGSGQRGRVALPGNVPIGYYKDPKKSAETFITYEGRRYSMPGDYAEILADGKMLFLGRGSVCINTGGEKVFPEEVEEVLKRHDAVKDAVCVGVPNDRFGEAVCGVVECGTEVSAEDLREFVKKHLAGYKAPRHIVKLPTLGRAPNGKADYRGLKKRALAELGISTR
jgi:fatty-acyl-CoA synthase